MITNVHLAAYTSDLVPFTGLQEDQ